MSNMEEDPEMESHVKSFLKVWTITIACLCYCYYIASKIPRGILRLLSLLPIFYLFLILPLEIIKPFQLRGIIAFSLAWLANFKLILFSFDQGPLSPLPQKLLQFISVACLPIKLKHGDPSSKTRKSTPLTFIPRWALLTIKALILAVLVHSYGYKHLMHPYVVLSLYCVHLYLQLEIMLVMCATPARILGFELEPQFDGPYLATSLQDFWGRRWNLMASNILRPAVYKPIRSCLGHVTGPVWASLLAIIAAFTASGLMHELMYYHITLVSPTWEVTWFFVLQGVAVAIEVAVKTAVAGGWRLHRVVSGPLTIAFVGLTGFWLFFPQLVRNGVDEKVIAELSLMMDLLRDKFSAILVS